MFGGPLTKNNPLLGTMNPTSELAALLLCILNRARVLETDVSFALVNCRRCKWPYAISLDEWVEA
jgi:hypothetical protein